MTKVVMLFFVMWTTLGVVSSAVSAEDRPVLVELFTSQGCSSCPPADALMAQYSKEPGVVALAFHVDYWDYIGWKDIFAQPVFTRRQKFYARRNAENMVYTPQVIVQGQDLMVGSKGMDIASAVKRHSHIDTGLDLSVYRESGDLVIDITGRDIDANITPDVFLVELLPSHTVQILKGENKGKEITYHNIVKSMSRIGTYQSPKWTKRVKAMGQSFAVIVQDRDHGPVLAAQILR